MNKPKKKILPKKVIVSEKSYLWDLGYNKSHNEFNTFYKYEIKKLKEKFRLKCHNCNELHDKCIECVELQAKLEQKDKKRG